MYRVYGDIQSGNCYKIKLLMNLLDIAHEWIALDVREGTTQTQEFMAMNPNGKIPVLAIDSTTFLTESNAILYYLSQGTAYFPQSKLPQAQVLQWQFFEQYSHEPYIAVARYINKFLGLPQAREAEYHAKQAGGYRALRVMEQQLACSRYLVGDLPTIADISLYAYTHVAHEGGFSLEPYEHIQRWITQIQAWPNYLGMEACQ